MDLRRGAPGDIVAAFWVDSSDVFDGQLVLRGEEAHHVHKVRRQQIGDFIDAVDGEGHSYRAQLVEIGRDRVVAAVVEHGVDTGESPVRFVLAPALLKGQRFDFVVEKATELGVAAIWPTLSARGVARAGSDAKVERWQRLARAAVKQCGRSRLPQLKPPEAFDVVVRHLIESCDVVFMGALSESGTARVGIGGEEAVSSAGLLIGPEGGFSPGEIALAQGLGVRTFCWGERVLRADTASIVLSGLLLSACARSTHTSGKAIYGD